MATAHDGMFPVATPCSPNICDAISDFFCGLLSLEIYRTINAIVCSKCFEKDPVAVPRTVLQ